MNVTAHDAARILAHCRHLGAADWRLRTLGATLTVESADAGARLSPPEARVIAGSLCSPSRRGDPPDPIVINGVATSQLSAATLDH